MPSKKRKYNARFPAGRIKKIMQTDEEVGKVAQAVPIIISRTLELFVESLLKKSMEVTVSRNAKTLSPSHVKQCILSEARFDFLKDLVRNVPDVSAAEEREQSLQTPGTPPSEIRYPEAAIPPPSRSSPHSQPSTSRAQQSSHSVRGRRPASVSSMSSEQPRSSPIVQYREEHNGRRTDPSNQPEDLSKRRVPNFYQETLPDSSDASQESVSNHSSVIQVNPAYAPKPIEQLSEEPKPKIDLNQPLYRIDLTRVPLQSSTSFESALPPRPPLNFDFSRNPLRADVKYGGMDLASGPPRDNVKYSGMDLASGPPRDNVKYSGMDLASGPPRDAPSRDAPPRAQAAPGQRSTSRPQPPPLVPISQLLKPMNLDEDYDA